ncbi:fumarylacetoacetase [Novosphingobium cyanobacteriorum]|uniref:fumarylacetoacetase n=1 Tax=Novosphingobium cyanobacteriorum TaxID=3024215 RepID=A0ABT6CF58_9SPHN|nr:fumarylacetoacetase [Novosphingobium cyanobacteriorum]MDF8331725.1 fumarylacetoacetase [Novosphingobium cyanobacteriorum]
MAAPGSGQAGMMAEMMLDHTHDPAAHCWVPGADAHPDFPVQNLPLGVYSIGGGSPRIGVAIGDMVLDAQGLPDLPGDVQDALRQPTLNRLFALPPAERTRLRHALFAYLTGEPAKHAPLHAVADCTLHLPFTVGDYTDFYVGIHHATNIGALFRPDNPLLPNYRHVPIGYHGRASSVRVSGTPVVRPNGQTKAPDAAAPGFGPCRRLDYELELGVWIAGDNELGQPVPIAQAWDRIGGLCVLNDWSARDIQAWEYQPLGPFLAKNFCTSVSPWVVTAEALAPFRTAPRLRSATDPKLLPYLANEADAAFGALSLQTEVALQSAAMRAANLPPVVLSRGDSADAMYWTLAQLVTHHASNGCDLRAGDLLGTGTLSGPARESFGSLMELSEGGKRPVPLPGGEERTFLEDGDTLTITVRAEREGARTIGLGTCTGTIAPAR